MQKVWRFPELMSKNSHTDTLTQGHIWFISNSDQTHFFEMYTWPGTVKNLLWDLMWLNCGLRCCFRRVELNDGTYTDYLFYISGWSIIKINSASRPDLSEHVFNKDTFYVRLVVIFTALAVIRKFIKISRFSGYIDAGDGFFYITTGNNIQKIVTNFKSPT